MPRSIRIEVAGGFYHVMARGNRRENIFLGDDDRGDFLKALGEACAMTGWRVHAWVLLSNHYHLMVETPEANLVAGMQWLQNTVTRRFNVRHRAWGRVFGDRYKAVAVEGRSRFYYETLMDYIHLNPVRAGLVRPSQKQSVLDYRWSSLRTGYGVPPGRRAKWLVAEEGLAVFGLPDTTAGRRRFVERLDRRAVEEGARRAGVVPLPEERDARCSHLRRGWYWGSQSFGEKLLDLAQPALKRKKSRAYRRSAQQQSHGLKQAEQWLEQGLAAAGLSEEDLGQLKGSDPRKVALAELLWRRTTVSQEWLAERLRMRSAANVSQLLRRRRTGKCAAPPRALGAFVREMLHSS
jgi:REP element-mobilizing transposase RayT